MPGIERAAPLRTETSKRILCVAELLAEFLFERGDALGDVVHEARRQLAAALVVEIADFGRDREARRHRQADAGHLGQVRTLAAQQLLLRAIALGLGATEVIDHFWRMPVRVRHVRRILVRGGVLRFAFQACRCHVVNHLACVGIYALGYDSER